MPAASQKIARQLDKVNMGEAYRKVEEGLHKTGSKVSFEVAARLVPKCLALGQKQPRVQLSLSHSRLAEMKSAATPTTGDGWVSTQEAVIAHLVHTLWRILKPQVRGKGVFNVSSLVDVRKYLKLPNSFAFGTGFQVCSIYVPEMNDKMHDNVKGVQEVAAIIHEESKKMAETAAKRWCLWHRAFEYRVDFEDFMNDIRSNQRSDMSITINNNSKREAPDFGPNAGGVATQFMSNMGPTLFIATKDGMDVLLEGEMFANAPREIENFKKSLLCRS
jgi:hypothetical protein